MFDYIHITDSYTKIFEKNKIIDYKGREGIIKLICKKHFIDYTKYMSYARRELEDKYNIPIYLSPNLLLFKIKCQNDLYYFNYFEIERVEYSSLTKLIFNDGNEVVVKINPYGYERIERRIDNLIKHIESVQKEIIW